jgi:hypothetical protein
VPEALQTLAHPELGLMDEANRIRAELSRCAADRVRARGAGVKAKKELLEWLSKAHKHPEISKAQCAQLIGFKNRETVYELLKERTE